MNDAYTIRMVVGGLLALAVLSLVGGFVLAFSERTIPDFVVAIGTGSMGAVAGILARGGRDDVRVVNESADPVPVEGDHA